MANSKNQLSKSKTKSAQKTAKSKKVSSTAKATATKVSTKKVNPVSSTADIVKTTVSDSGSSKKSTAAKKRFAFKRANKSKTVTLSNVVRLHTLSAVLFAALAVVAALLMKPMTFSLSLGHVTKDQLLSIAEKTTVFAPAQHPLMDIDLRWCVVGILIVSALLSMLRMRRIKNDDLGIRVQPMRWIDAAVTGAMIVSVVALLSGMQELVGMKLLSVVAAFAFVFAWIAERENARSTEFVRFSYLASLVAGALVIVALAAHTDATLMYGMIRSPWYVYALDALAVVVAFASAFMQRRALTKTGSASNYLVVERDYARLNLIAKAAFAVILIVGLYASL